MWAIDNRTPYKAGKTWGRDKEGRHQWIVAVKASFDIRPDGSTALSEQQNEPLIAPEYHGEPGVSSLRYEADLVAPKPTTDILLHGNAHAPGGRPSTEFAISMQVGSLRKVLVVKGDRRFTEGRSKASRPEPLIQIPVVYERAYGGYDHDAREPQDHRMDARNPVGCGLVGASGRCAGLALPNFEYLNGNLEKDGPAGFGPIDAYWSPRRELMGTYDENWQATRLPLLPQDWSADSLLCAPADQRMPNHLRGGEPVELINLSPVGTLRFSLPTVHLAFTTRHDGRLHEHRARLSSVILEPEHPRVMMVWCTALAVRNNGDYLEETIVREKRPLRS